MRVFGWMGFKLLNAPPKEMQRCVLLFVPHTSNWDFVNGVTCMKGLNMPIKVAIKNFWTTFPFGLLVKPIGGIGIDRSKTAKVSQVDQLAKVFKEHERIAFVITPEGSRSLRTNWKTGFYYIAQKANVPIITIKGDYKFKTVEFGPVIYPSATFEECMKEVMAYYKACNAKFPEKYSPDIRYI